MFFQSILVVVERICCVRSSRNASARVRARTYSCIDLRSVIILIQINDAQVFYTYVILKVICILVLHIKCRAAHEIVE